MPTTLACIWAVEPLGDRGTGSRRFFGLAGSFGLVRDGALPTTADLAWVKPWNWRAPQLHAAVFNGAATQPIANAVLHDAHPRIMLDRPTDPLATPAEVARRAEYAAVDAYVKSRLEYRVECVRRAAVTSSGPDAMRLFTWDPVAPTAVVADERPWPTQLADVSTAPFPLPQLANLSFIFSVPAANLPAPGAGWRVYATISFTHDVAGQLVVIPAQAPTLGSITVLTPDPTSAAPRAVRWAYDVPDGAPAGIPVPAGYVGGCDIDPPSATGSLINLKSGWIGDTTPGAVTPVFTNDWLAALPTRSGELFDVAQRIVDALGSVVRTNPNTLGEVPADSEADRVQKGGMRRAIGAMVVAAAHDTADAGLRVGPSGQSLFEVLWERWSRARLASLDAGEVVSVIVTRLNAIAAAVRAVPLPMIGDADWRKLVRSTVVELRQNSVLVGERPPVSALELQRDVDQLCARLRDPSVVGSLVAKQLEAVPHAAAGVTAAESNAEWRRFIAWVSTEAATWNLWRHLATNALGQRSSQAADANSGSPWSILSNVLSSGTAVGQHSALRDMIEELVSVAVRGRFNVPAPAGQTPDAAAREAAYARYAATFSPSLTVTGAATITAADVARAVSVLSTAITADARAGAALVVPAKITDAAAAPSSDDARTREPLAIDHAVQALTLQVDRLAPLTDADDAADFLRQMSGVGVLMRAAGANAWQCLNVAALLDVSDPPLPAGDAPCPRRAKFPTASRLTPAGARAPTFVVPLRLAYRDDVRQAFLSYDNQPIGSRSPVQVMNDHTLVRNDPSAVTATPATPAKPDALDLGEVDSLWYYDYPDPSASPWHQLPGLVFGKSYELAPFVIRNSGALPPPLVDTADYPARIRASNGSPLVTDVINAGVPIQKVDYFRRVRVSPPRVGPGALTYTDAALAPNASPRNVGLPPIPDGVNAYANERKQTLGTGGTRPLLMLGPVSEPRSRLPHTCTLTIRPPSIDIVTWDRWIASRQTFDRAVDGGNRPTSVVRKTVWAKYHELLLENHRDPAQIKEHDISIDDPAVESIEVRLERVTTAGGAPIPAQIVPVKRFQVPDSLAPVQDRGFKVQVQSNSGSTAAADRLTLDAATRTVTASVREGEVYRLTLAPVLETGAATRFAAPVRAAPSSALEMLVEVATMKMPTADDLRTKLQVRFALNANDPKSEHALAVGLDAKTITYGRHVSRVDLMRQMWRWSGRPWKKNVPNPADAGTLNTGRITWSADAAQATSDWEAYEFALRFDDEHDVECMDADVATLAPGGVEFKWSTDLERDRRALYYRFAVRAWSRYDLAFRPPLAAETAAADSAAQKDALTLTADTRTERWLSLLVPSRIVDVPRMPLVRGVYPLTDDATEAGETNGADSAGLLVVVDEPWYELGGVAERFEARIAAVDANGEETNPPNAATPQYGPDPTRSTAAGDLKCVAGATNACVPLTTTGAIGHTFDDPNLGRPRFLTTSFIVEPPAGTAQAPWAFAKLQFDRVIRSARGTASAWAATPADMRAGWSTGLWAQFLPKFSVLRTEIGGRAANALTKDLVLRASGASLVIRDLSGADRRIITGDDRAVQYLLVSREVADVGGRVGQEAFVGVFTQAAGTATWSALDPARVAPRLGLRTTATAADLGTALSGIPLVARLADIQRGSLRGEFIPANEAEFWAKLFDQAELADDPPALVPLIPGADKWPTPLNAAELKAEQDRARITRVSAPIRAR